MATNQRFRLLGIRTGKRISSDSATASVRDYLKILKEETYYPFYNCYSFDDKRKTLIYHPKMDVDIYNNGFNNKVNVQISAIVGKNGTGKSTLLELIYLAKYNLGVRYDLLYERIPSASSENDEYKKCDPLTLSFELYFEKAGKVEKLLFDNVSIQYFVGKVDSKNEVVFRSETNGNELRGAHDELAQMFYSIAVNYSIYGLNSRSVGDWIIPLFHKNDGYKTPLVINPMRTEGDFNINDEMEFATNRLLNNLLIQQNALGSESSDKVFVTDRQYVENIRFKLKSFDVEQFQIKDTRSYISGPEQGANLLLNLYSEYYDELELDKIQFDLVKFPFKDEIQFYIVRKANKILRTYTEYRDKFLKNGEKFNWEKSKDFARAIVKDNSHITFKVKQALNYLRNCHYALRQGKDLKWNEQRKKEWIEFSLVELLDFMHSKDIENIIFNIPPSIFTIQIELSDGTNHTQKAYFSDLSSGEQQLIHSVNTVLYHLNNLQSAHYSNDGRLAYNDVNIIFDEIELYFHPEFQRKFISTLIESINRLPIAKDKGLKALNILFSTHSPFILSDIPSQNLLMLHVDGDSKRSEVVVEYDQTFGANIHDLLANSFFLSHGYTGQKAVELINDVITKLNKWKSEKGIDISAGEREKVRSIIFLIGNELVRRKLTEMHDDIFNDVDFREKLAEEYENRAKELRKRRND